MAHSPPGSGRIDGFRFTHPTVCVVLRFAWRWPEDEPVPVDALSERAVDVLKDLEPVEIPEAEED